MEKGDVLTIDDANMEVIIDVQKKTGLSFSHIVNEFLAKGIILFLEECERETERQAKKKNDFTKSLDFINVQMMYMKSGAKEPQEYNIHIKEVLRENDQLYMKAVKKGERRIKKFKVSSIHSMRMDDMEIEDPVSFLLEGIVSEN